MEIVITSEHNHFTGKIKGEVIHLNIRIEQK